jgi:hypothetical protein
MDHSDPTCAAVGHAYVNAFAVYCRHRQAWSVAWSVHLDPDADGRECQLLASGSIELGPFDTTTDALRELQERLEAVAPLATA